MEYTNAVSQFLKAKELYNEVKGANNKETFENAKKRKAKFMPVALYVVCTVIALIIAYNYFSGIENPWLRYGAIVLTGVFNIPFLGYYAVWHVALKKDSPSYSQEEFLADRSEQMNRLRAMRARPSYVYRGGSALSESLDRTFQQKH